MTKAAPQLTLAITLLCLTLTPLSPVTAEEAEREAIYGWHLMSREERAHYKLDLQRLDTPQQRNDYRQQHRLRMQQRAQRLGATLPELEEVLEESPRSGTIRR